MSNIENKINAKQDVAHQNNSHLAISKANDECLSIESNSVIPVAVETDKSSVDERKGTCAVQQDIAQGAKQLTCTNPKAHSGIIPAQRGDLKCTHGKTCKKSKKDAIKKAPGHRIQKGFVDAGNDSFQSVIKKDSFNLKRTKTAISSHHIGNTQPSTATSRRRVGNRSTHDDDSDWFFTEGW